MEWERSILFYCVGHEAAMHMFFALTTTITERTLVVLLNDEVSRQLSNCSSFYSIIIGTKDVSQRQ